MEIRESRRCFVNVRELFPVLARFTIIGRPDPAISARRRTRDEIVSRALPCPQGGCGQIGDKSRLSLHAADKAELCQ
jgi:hypothetical protein